jgi:hypothetical protein
MAPPPPERGGREEKSASARASGMSTQALDLFMFAVALVAAVAFAYYYVMGVLEKDRLLSRGAVGMFLLFGAVATIMLVRIL